MAVERTGFAGRLARTFVDSKLTPVIAIASVLLGVFSVIVTAKEEEPQISVPMIDIQTPAPGLSAAEVERKVSEPIERAVWGLEGVEYVYSSSSPSGSLVTVRFRVGEPMEPSLVKVHHKLLLTEPDLPREALSPVVRSYSIDDVPFLVLTFSSPTMADEEIRSWIAPLARELSSTPDLSRVELLGGLRRSVRVIVDPVRLAARGVSLGAVGQALQSNNAYGPAGKTWGPKKVFDVDVGGRISAASQVAKIAIGQRGGQLVRISDVADIVDGPEARVRESFLLSRGGSAGSAQGAPGAPMKAVSISFAKRRGTNVVQLSNALIARAGVFAQALPSGIHMSIMRDYGDTAAEKARELIEHLLLATLSVSVLIALAMGIRAALVVAIAIPVTLALTLALYYFMGYSLNRVTLFALIFSIGILVDDAIVVVENVERHLKSEERAPGLAGTVAATLRAVSEVGNPTILATFTVIAAILPMAFVRGLMGPYMKPIPVGASLAMILSLFVAFTVTPWAAVRLLAAHHPRTSAASPGADEEAHPEGALDRGYRMLMEGLLTRKTLSAGFGVISLVLLLVAVSLLFLKVVKVKMLPFDNKNEFQVLLDYPPTTPLGQSALWSTELARILLKNPEVLRVQVFAGEAAPFSFSGMVKHTFLRKTDYQNDLQIVLTGKNERKASSHEIIESLRPAIRDFARAHQAVSKVLEIPPGPPVMATVVAEVYGPDPQARHAAAVDVLRAFEREPSVVDLDYSWRPGRPREIYPYDQSKGGLLGTRAAEVLATGRLIFSETPLLSLAEAQSPEDIWLNLSVRESVRSGPRPFSNEFIPSFESGVARVSGVLDPAMMKETVTLFRKNLKPVSYVTSELSGPEESPVYGILKLSPEISFPQQTAEVPWNTNHAVVKWDGEWFITYEVFRDLGTAFAVVLVLIYILVLGWFKSFAVPLVIMAPIPISLIGVIPGHALLGAYFTATSMIGFIAGAGIIVRNSIILVDFIEHQLAKGIPLKEAVVSAGVLRFRPMLLTAAAVVVGSSVMLFDPIFQGLAISLMFGEVAATLLSRMAVPLLYFWFVGKSRARFVEKEARAA